jgi:hypothetical protein
VLDGILVFFLSCTLLEMEEGGSGGAGPRVEHVALVACGGSSLVSSLRSGLPSARALPSSSSRYLSFGWLTSNLPPLQPAAMRSGLEVVCAATFSGDDENDSELADRQCRGER